jgi:hypothetical protein
MPSPGTIIVSVLLLAIVAFIIYRMVKARQRGKSVICSDCSEADNCPRSHKGQGESGGRGESGGQGESGQVAHFSESGEAGDCPYGDCPSAYPQNKHRL